MYEQYNHASKAITEDSETGSEAKHRNNSDKSSSASTAGKYSMICFIQKQKEKKLQFNGLVVVLLLPAYPVTRSVFHTGERPFRRAGFRTPIFFQ